MIYCSEDVLIAIESAEFINSIHLSMKFHSVGSLSYSCCPTEWNLSFVPRLTALQHIKLFMIKSLTWLCESLPKVVRRGPHLNSLCQSDWLCGIEHTITIL